MGRTMQTKLTAAQLEARYQGYKGRRVAKLFPGYGDELFYGTVKKIAKNAKDDLPFFIEYDDNDREWVTYDELMTILVPTEQEEQVDGAGANEQKGNSSGAAGRKRKSAAAAAGDAAADGDGAPSTTDASRDSHADQDRPAGKRAASASKRAAPHAAVDPAAALELAAGVPAAAAPPPAAVADKQEQHQQPAAEATPSRPTQRRTKVAAPAAAAGGGGGGASKVAAAGPTPGAPSTAGGSKAGPRGLADPQVAATVEAALEAAPRRTKEPAISRAPWTGKGSAGTPHSCTFVRLGKQVFISLASRAVAVWGTDYEAEVNCVLHELDQALAAAGSSRKLLLTVRVYLRDIVKGMVDFTPLWNEYVDKTSLPVLTVLQAGGAAGSSVVLEAVAVAPGKDQAGADQATP